MDVQTDSVTEVPISLWFDFWKKTHTYEFVKEDHLKKCLKIRETSYRIAISHIVS